MRKSIENLFAEKLSEEYNKREPENCAVQRFFEEQQKLPPAMRSSAAYISCRCKRCNPYTL